MYTRTPYEFLIFVLFLRAGMVENGIFPDPDIRKMASKTKTEILSVPLPDNSVTDSDLHDHDLIDSVMYIYFGGATHGQRGAGRQVSDGGPLHFTVRKT